MTIELSVHDVCAELQRAAGPSPAPSVEPSTRLLGQLFHHIFAELTDVGSAHNAFLVLEGAKRDRDRWRVKLMDHAYDRLVGPRLLQHQAQLQACTPQVLAFWAGIRDMIGWLVEIAWSGLPQGDHDPAAHWRALRASIKSEVPLSHTFERPDWSEPVTVTGVADAVLVRAGAPCVVELKLGRSHVEADLAQVCLYHLTFGPSAPGAAALIRFGTSRQETVFEAQRIREAQDRLLDLIGAMTGVRRPTAKSPEPAKVADPGDPWALSPPDRKETAKKIEAALREFKLEVRVPQPPIEGPTFLRYLLALGPGVRVQAVKSRAKHIELRLGLERPVRIDQVRNRVAVDVQRPDRQIVPFARIVGELFPEDGALGSARIPVGVDLDNKLHFANLANPMSAHLLVAGTTGSGKSEWMRTAIAGLIAANTPSTLRLVLIDPKHTAFGELRRSPFLLDEDGLVFPTETPVIAVLDRLIEEMNRRYAGFGEAGVDDLNAFRRKRSAALPRIVVFCDEYMDLVSGDAKERAALELCIQRLGAKARAAGIHLVIATQQPNRQVISAAIRTNLPATVGLTCADPTESRVLLNEPSAAALLGHGDLLYKSVGRPVRLQAPLMSEAERARFFGPSPADSAVKA